MSYFKKFFVSITIMCGCVLTYAQQTYIVSVGIANYKEINGLRYAEDDVSLFNHVMSQYENVNITSLVGSQATHTDVLKTIRNVFSQATPSDAVIFFFSGHGYEGGFCCYDMNAKSHLGGLSYQEMQILLRNCRAGRKMVLADACFSGGLSKQRTQLQVQAVSNQDVIFFLSSRLDETSLELPQGPNGLYTYFLVKGLTGFADINNDGVISTDEIYKYVSNEVSSYVDQIPHNQHPTMWCKKGKDLPIIRYK
ncbi:MAG: caspase family protein [Pseudoflavonifractor sp.]|nr:caspase family protein [Alloprevotella sp.]MCM1116001.1 caspase family protein [Pseudoflavonifractor sp.]